MTNSISKVAYHFLAISIAFVLAILAFSMPAKAEERIALVIGNSSYSTVSPLDNPTRDARLIAETLQEIDFEVTWPVQEELVHCRQRRDRPERLHGRTTVGETVGRVFGDAPIDERDQFQWHIVRDEIP